MTSDSDYEDRSGPAAAEAAVREDLRPHDDVVIGRSRLSVNIGTTRKRRQVVAAAAQKACKPIAGLRRTECDALERLVLDADWGRAKALPWLLAILKVDPSKVVPFYVGAYATAEPAFLWLRDRGMESRLEAVGAERRLSTAWRTTAKWSTSSS